MTAAATSNDPKPAAQLPDALALLGLLALGVGLPLVLGMVAGSILIPHNDDPSMRRVALGLFDTGRLALNGWTSMTLVGQIAFVQPFLWVTGGGPWAFAAATMSLAVVGIVSSYLVVRRILPWSRATVAVLGALLFPGFLLNTTTFMTDVPAWAMSMTCLGLGAAALDRVGRDRWRWLIGSLAVGWFAFSIREFAIAAPLAVLVACAASDPGYRRPYLLAGVFFLTASAATYLFAVHLPGQHEAPPQLITALTIRGLFRAFATLALVLSPALVLAAWAWWRRWRLPDAVVGGAVGLLIFREAALALVRTGSSSRLLLGNLLEPTGNLGVGTLTGGRPMLYPSLVWTALNTVALLSAIGLCAIAGGAAGGYLRGGWRESRGRRGLERLALRVGSTRGLLAVFAAIYAGGIFSWGFAVIMFDRYLWLLSVPLYALLLASPGDPIDTPRADGAPSGANRPRLASISRGVPIGLAAVLLTGLGATSLVLLVNGDAFEAARWRMGDIAVARGTPAGTVDAGLEWVAFHATGVATPYALAPPGWSRYDAWWPSFRLCALVSASLLDRADLHLIRADPAAYRLLELVGPAKPLYLYGVTEAGCP